MKRPHKFDSIHSKRRGVRLTWLWLLTAIHAFHPAQENVSTEAVATDSNWHHEEIRRFAAAEAVQGVAADDQYLYVIANRAIGKYRKKTGERVSGWTVSLDVPIIHLNAGLVREGRLYCAHSNYPGVPTLSSLILLGRGTIGNPLFHFETNARSDCLADLAAKSITAGFEFSLQSRCRSGESR